MSWSSDHSHPGRLSDLPPWGVEIMMGLYGPDTIAAALESERAAASHSADRAAASLAAVGFVPLYVPPSAADPETKTPRPEKAVPVGELGCAQMNPALADFAAVDALGRRLAQLFTLTRSARHRRRRHPAS